ncbi:MULTISPECIES: metal ABC transporter solute-binding protein, Zn/Mn family [unclassified Streptomyces]|uniref:metal ABC transporter solute-binding protein, Zn/Mn family n=1 Tax=unclassified Streptomyces TaxID=2593676 RepID=UPI002251A48C|nr:MULTISPECIES: zinc ABC transporter substrate-binding protein [unclassified Streptomyces]WTB41257.1 zinc ABC transporter substrate-binding protein [Streptomyces sp. NBC_00827]WUC11122.1 zinc ABC transporter substrate-binding protein [Streptomyces sp. NBC_00564]WUC52354.1 zinc ABC transporter substrate-binding protein [Streptomyces sp. NBC_00554]MCX4974647.1 zinc ABC transporter substrate-binding protein [Streptomyces sp. NBC_00620]WRZ22657.1 zinc ABC transporter substrate-binding protein [St
MNVRRRLISGTAVTAATFLGLATLSACSDSSAADSNSSGKLDVVASFYPLQYLAEEIGGDHVSVTNLTEPGQEPHDLEISAKQTAQLQEADAVLYLKNLQPAVDDAVAQSEVKTKIDAATLTTLEKHGNEVGGHAAEHDDTEGEETGATDPHIWLDPVKYAEVAEGVGKAFEKEDPDNAGEYKSNTAALVKKLDALNTQYADGLKNTTSKVFITTHAAFGYLAERYGLTEEAINGLDPESEPSANRVKDLETMAKADGVTTVFYETLVSDDTAKTIAKDAGLKTDVLDPIEGITDKSKGDDYLQVMESNLKALETALGAK